jgi:hypothetical protein
MVHKFQEGSLFMWDSSWEKLKVENAGAIQALRELDRRKRGEARERAAFAHGEERLGERAV